MSTDSGSKLRDVLAASLAPDMDSTSRSLILSVLTGKKWHLSKHAADAAGSTAYEIPVDSSLDYQVMIDSVKVLPGAALTGDATNNATISLEYDDGAGGANTVVATLTTTANWTAQTPVSVAITASNAVIAAGKQLIIKVAKSGTGVVIPACVFEIKGHCV